MKKLFVLLLLAFASALASAAEPICNWDRPGFNKYQGKPVDALRDYTLNYQVRAVLQVKIRNQMYDDVVEIRRDGIKGSTGTFSNLRGMHYGQGSYCPGSVDTGNWTETQVERALVYCVAEVCVAVPTICNNVSLIDRDTPIGISPSAGSSPTGGAPQSSINPSPEQPGSELGAAVSQEVSRSDSLVEQPAEEGPGSELSPDVVPGGFGGSGGGYAGGGDFGGGGVVLPGRSTSPPICPGLNCGLNPPVITPIPAVPEIPEWILIVAGLICFAWRMSTRQK